ncbi:DUF397 domain-containing protein [Streptomyces sp. NPDC002926]
MNSRSRHSPWPGASTLKGNGVSTDDGPDCVEIATTTADTIHVRDSKNTKVPRLVFGPVT